MTAPNPSRNPWPIAIAGFFILAITFLAAFIAWAVHQREDLVAQNYYEDEIRFQQQLDRLNRSQPFSTETVVSYDPERCSIIIALPGGHAQGANGRIHLYRPSDARLDLEVPLTVDASGVQQLDAKRLRDGLWKIRLQWSAGGQEYFLERMVLVARGAAVSVTSERT